ncbi:hypothetical protein [Burkholderia multivorans]|uniref:hypothetical protein n=1 Tax=Burkholderia multivorans TaxID=87883 RepID=UPI001C3D669D|nr:hypothetical protein [Burkholderia multivorans]
MAKEFAGRQVLIEEREPGVWLVRTAVVIPENEAWLHALRLDMTCRKHSRGLKPIPRTNRTLTPFSKSCDMHKKTTS